jgi:hypothetical protein
MSSYYAPRQSRLSVRPRARDSIFPGGSEWHCTDPQSPFSPDLLESVLAMEDCCEEVSRAPQFCLAILSELNSLIILLGI